MYVPLSITRSILYSVAFLLAALGVAGRLAAQADAGVTVHVTHDTLPVTGATVRSGGRGVFTDAGIARLMLPAGSRDIVVAMIGFAPETLHVTLTAGADTTVVVPLRELPVALSEIIVTSTRSERLVADEPTRVEVIGPEDVAEKTAMSPGNVAAVLNETSGVRVQTTSAALGAASVRVQGLRGHYTEILSDGLPLYGLTTDGIGLLQIPPVDLQQVEVIKGAATALYGPAALGGVVNLVSRRPSNASEILVNGTSRRAGDLVLWQARQLSPAWGYTLIAGLHGQRGGALDDDLWLDFPSYERGELRPRVFWTSPAGHSLLLTSGVTVEDREGGTPPGGVLPDGRPFAQTFGTRRADVGAVGRFQFNGTSALAIRSSATEAWRTQQFGTVRERDRRTTVFAEAALTVTAGSQVAVIGAALQHDGYDAPVVAALSYAGTTPGVFVQHTWLPKPWFGLTSSARVDASSRYGAFVSPRVSALLRSSSGWTARLSAGGGAYEPSPFTDETAEIDFARLRPLTGLVAERGRSASLDVGGMLGPIEVNGTLYGSVIDHPVALRPVPPSDSLVEFVNAAAPTRANGFEAFARYRREPFTVTATYAFQHASELDVEKGSRRTVPLTPRHAGGLDVSWEDERGDRIGIEGFYTGRQTLVENPYRSVSRPYLLLGALLQHRFARVLLFLNAENLLNIHQTQFDPLYLPAVGAAGRWTTGAWAPLEGRVINLGARFRF
jgi:iron complex outermembrane receptor protein